VFFLRRDFTPHSRDRPHLFRTLPPACRGNRHCGRHRADTSRDCKCKTPGSTPLRCRSTADGTSGLVYCVAARCTLRVSPSWLAEERRMALWVRCRRQCSKRSSKPDVEPCELPGVVSIRIGADSPLRSLPNRRGDLNATRVRIEYPDTHSYLSLESVQRRARHRPAALWWIGCTCWLGCSVGLNEYIGRNLKPFVQTPYHLQ
jgi:hypothetical protein